MYVLVSCVRNRSTHHSASVGAVGAPVAGRISDRILVLVGWCLMEKREWRNGRWAPEDRLRAAMPRTLILVPLSVLLSGMFTHFVPGTTELLLDMMMCLFVSGIGVRYAFPAPGTNQLTVAAGLIDRLTCMYTRAWMSMDGPD